MEVSIKSLCFKFNILFSCRPLKSHDFVLRLMVFSSISQSDDETGKSHDKQRHKLKRCNFLYNFIFGLLRWVLRQILCKSIVKLSQTKLPFCSVFIRLFAAVCWRHSLWPYIVDMFQITSPSLPVSHILITFSIADEPDGYLSDEECG